MNRNGDQCNVNVAGNAYMVGYPGMIFILRIAWSAPAPSREGDLLFNKFVKQVEKPYFSLDRRRWKVSGPAIIISFIMSLIMVAESAIT